MTCPWFDRLTMIAAVILSLSKDGVVRQAHHDWFDRALYSAPCTQCHSPWLLEKLALNC